MTLKSGFSERKRRSFCINGSFTESVILKRRKPIKGYMFLPAAAVCHRPEAGQTGQNGGKGALRQVFWYFCGLFTFVIEK